MDQTRTFKTWLGAESKKKKKIEECNKLFIDALLYHSLQESILSHVQRIVKGEVSLAMKEQQAVVTSSIMQAMRSAAGTPVPTAHLDYQTQQANILQLLQQGQVNQAFQQVTGCGLGSLSEPVIITLGFQLGMFDINFLPISDVVLTLNFPILISTDIVWASVGLVVKEVECTMV